MKSFQADIISSWRQRFATLVSGVSLPLFLVWALYSAYVFLHVEALIPDERDFVILANTLPLSDMVTRAPLAWYGSLFWVSLKVAGSAHIARAAVLLMFVLTPWLLLRTVAEPRMRTPVLVVWLSMPIAWWGGKLIAPEIPIMFLVALALYLFDRGRLKAAAIALAAATACKISALPAVMFFAVAYGLQPVANWSHKLRQAPQLAGVFVLTLFLLCPPLLAIITELGTQPAQLAQGALLARIDTSLLAYRWEWDGVFSGGVLHFSLMPMPLALVAVGMLIRDLRMFAAAAVSAGAFLYMNINSPTAYGWYWIAYFPIFLYALSRQRDSGIGAGIPWCAVLYLAAACNAAQQLPLIVDQAYQRIEQIRILNKRDEILSCINQKLDELKPASVYNLAEFGLTLQRDVPVYATPGPGADEADVRLIGTRMLVGRRMTYGPWPQAGRLYATCDAVMIFTRN